VEVVLDNRALQPALSDNGPADAKSNPRNLLIMRDIKCVVLNAQETASITSFDNFTNCEVFLRSAYRYA
jgi:hypothetical protein